MNWMPGNRRFAVRLLAAALVWSAAGCVTGPQPAPTTTTLPLPLEALQAKLARLQPVDITASVAGLAPQDRQALDKLIAAAQLMDPLFLRQVWSGNEALARKLAQDDSPRGRAELAYFRVNAGAWERLDAEEVFLPGVPRQKPPKANFYPEDMTKAEFERWVKGLAPAARDQAQGFFHLVRRQPAGAPGAGQLTLVPYSEAYREFLEPAARLLREAADLTTHASLKRFLTSRADAFASNDYYASDLAWMDVDAPIEVTIGPYETYEDGLFNYKAAFEAFVTIRDDAECAKFARFGGYLQELEDHLPIAPAYRNPKLGGLAPIRVVDEVFCSGFANMGVQTAAYNLPNDERVIREKGCKRVLLRNVQAAKFQIVLRPIATLVLAPESRANVDFEPFFTHILMHELSHGLGPQQISKHGHTSSPRQELKDLYPAIEEAKADITGLFTLQYLIDQGKLPRDLERTLYPTFTASIFRSVRFGLTEAHSKGFAMIFNRLMDQGGIVLDPATGLFRVDIEKMKAATRQICGELLTIEAEGDYARAKALLKQYAVIRPAMRQGLDRLTTIPVDIAPNFLLAK